MSTERTKEDLERLYSEACLKLGDYEYRAYLAKIQIEELKQKMLELNKEANDQLSKDPQASPPNASPATFTNGNDGV